MNLDLLETLSSVSGDPVFGHVARQALDFVNRSKTFSQTISSSTQSSKYLADLYALRQRATQSSGHEVYRCGWDESIKSLGETDFPVTNAHIETDRGFVIFFFAEKDARLVGIMVWRLKITVIDPSRGKETGPASSAG
ncbi:hypothetical protein SAMN05421770_10690 [Granulicella rosea]|uniref:Uncharacterized protein n=1 Tax=Granulicella rosea TaxID=474952 RepID=A0A239L560_9BACT|nr:hypothetical protein [Granulicella rosea]SNT25122.1 hypothetical protein SAMN05421770_10690 [Granulicella rosea]